VNTAMLPQQVPPEPRYLSIKLRGRLALYRSVAFLLAGMLLWFLPTGNFTAYLFVFGGLAFIGAVIAGIVALVQWETT
jgi:hypothetical protein